MIVSLAMLPLLQHCRSMALQQIKSVFNEVKVLSEKCVKQFKTKSYEEKKLIQTQQHLYET